MARVRAQTVKAGRAVRFAYQQVGKPYQWGGAGPRTYDCSGLVMAAWRKGGLSLPHRADLQHRMIRRRVGIKNLQPGDLVFFSGDHHVGIYVGRHHFLHAPHTGTRVQRGTLSGWRLRAFAGAARPGAPEYRSWPHWVHTLADQEHRHGKSTANRRHQAEPDTGTPSDQDVPTSAEPSEAQPSDPAPAESAPPTGETPEASGASDSADGAQPAGEGSLTGGALSPLVTMSAPGRTARSGPAIAADTTPAPRPAATSGPANESASGSASQGGTAGQGRPHGHWPRTAVKRQHDEQRFDREYDDRSVGDEDAEPDNDGIDWKALLGNTP